MPRTGDDTDPGGTANSYNDENCANLKILGVKVTKDVPSLPKFGRGYTGVVVSVNEDGTATVRSVLSRHREWEWGPCRAN